MTSIICTLFEKDYHYGVATLTNSLYKQGFRGSIYAGYSGSLPSWCIYAKENSSLCWQGGLTLDVRPGLELHLLPLDTTYHLTNYKPDFMLRLLDGPGKHSKAIFYFDPDIVVTARWSFIEDWSDCGVSLCEDVNSPLPKNNPRRIAWRKYFGERGFDLTFKESIYANGGFVGINSKNFAFIELWRDLQCAMAPRIGGLRLSALTGAQLPKEESGPFAPFSKTDQDALNAAVEAWTGDISFIGKEGMAFSNGTPIMPHALGAAKPWRCKPVKRALQGSPPRQVDREYWKFVNDPIVTHPNRLVKFRRISLKIASFIGRFYHRSIMPYT